LQKETVLLSAVVLICKKKQFLVQFLTTNNNWSHRTVIINLIYKQWILWLSLSGKG